MIAIDSNKLSSEIKSKYSLTNNAFKLDKIKNAELDKYDGNPKDEINVIIGDDKQPDTFIPQVKLQRWTNEVNFSVRLVDKEAGQETITTTDKIKWSKGNLDIEFYDFVEGEGGYKMVWYLKKKPKTNKLNFTIQSKGLDFFYQPELTAEEIAQGCFRPENVVGSYAVYHSTKGGMIDKDGKDYKCGKAFHIYRPHIIDANGAETWGILHIENGIYSVEIPQEFLDNAVYPIKSNDTFGYTSKGGNVDFSVGECVKGNLYTLSAAGTVTSISVSNCSTFGALTKFVLGIYNSDKDKLGQTNEDTTIDGTNFDTVNLQSSVAVSAGNYWLIRMGDVEYLYYDNGSGAMHDDLSYSTTMPDPLTDDDGGRSTSRYYSIYATYTAAASGPANVKTYKGLAAASVKTCKGLAIASVKTKKGLN